MSPDSVAAPIRDRVRRAGRTTCACATARKAGPVGECRGDRAVVEEEGTYRFSCRRLRRLGLTGHRSRRRVVQFRRFVSEARSMLPRQHVGRIGVRVRGRELEGHALISVEPKKLEAATEYRQMLDDIAEVATEAGVTRLRTRVHRSSSTTRSGDRSSYTSSSRFSTHVYGGRRTGSRAGSEPTAPGVGRPRGASSARDPDARRLAEHSGASPAGAPSSRSCVQSTPESSSAR